MLKSNKTFVRFLLPVAVLLAIAFGLREIYEDSDSAMAQAVMSTCRNMIHISLLFMWVVSLHRRLMNKNVRRLMLCVGGLLIFWLVDKIVKWDFTGSVTHPLVRYLWYGFYVGMLFVPTLGMFIINYLGKPENYSHPKKLNYLLIPPTVMLLTVFTNDLHQKVFVFYNGFVNFDLEYSYDWAYFIIMGWFIVMGFYFVMMMLLKSRVPGSRRLQTMPLLIMVFAAVFWIGYSMRLYNCDLTVMDCLIICLLLECAIQIGLLPSNSSYQRIFRETTMPVRIVDRDYQTHFVSAGSMPLTEEILRKTASGTVDMGQYLLTSAPISGGQVIWQDDVTQLNKLRIQLQDTNEQLDEENVLLQAEVDLKQQRIKADEQNRLYDRIVCEVEDQLIKADALLSKIQEEPEYTRTLMAKVCVLGSYIKRRGNLLLLGEENQSICTRELEYCIRESLDNLRLGQVYTAFSCLCEAELPRKYIMTAYDFFETVVERTMDHITAMMVNLVCKGGSIRMNIQIGCDDSVDEGMLAGLQAELGSVTCEIMDEDAVIELNISEGGAAV